MILEREKDLSQITPSSGRAQALSSAGTRGRKEGTGQRRKRFTLRISSSFFHKKLILMFYILISTIFIIILKPFKHVSSMEIFYKHKIHIYLFALFSPSIMLGMFLYRDIFQKTTYHHQTEERYLVCTYWVLIIHPRPCFLSLNQRDVRRWRSPWIRRDNKDPWKPSLGVVW